MIFAASRDGAMNSPIHILKEHHNAHLHTLGKAKEAGNYERPNTSLEQTEISTPRLNIMQQDQKTVSGVFTFFPRQKHYKRKSTLPKGLCIASCSPGGQRTIMSMQLIRILRTLQNPSFSEEDRRRRSKI